jgi:hypothetical protein
MVIYHIVVLIGGVKRWERELCLIQDTLLDSRYLDIAATIKEFDFTDIIFGCCQVK